MKILNLLQYRTEQVRQGLEQTLRRIDFFQNRKNLNELEMVLPQACDDYRHFWEDLNQLNPELARQYLSFEQIIEAYGMAANFELTPERYFRLLDEIDWEAELPQPKVSGCSNALQEFLRQQSGDEEEGMH